MSNYQYLLKHPNSKKHLAYLEQQIAQLRAYKPNKRSKRNQVKGLLILYESLFDRLTLAAS